MIYLLYACQTQRFLCQVKKAARGVQEEQKATAKKGKGKGKGRSRGKHAATNSDQKQEQDPNAKGAPNVEQDKKREVAETEEKPAAAAQPKKKIRKEAAQPEASEGAPAEKPRKVLPTEADLLASWAEQDRWKWWCFQVVCSECILKDIHSW